MTKCLFKALKAVDLEKYVGLFRSLGYDSAGALARFRAEHFEKLKFTEQELLRLLALLDVLKEATRDGKICPHYFNSTKSHSHQPTIKSAPPMRASWSDETVPQRTVHSPSKKQSPTKRSSSSTMKFHSDDFTSPRPTTVPYRSYHTTATKSNTQRFSGPKAFLNRPAVQHVKVKAYNYGVPTNRRSRNAPHRSSYQHGSVFVSSSHHHNEVTSRAKPAEIYVYARKRPLLPVESTFQDIIAIPDNKRIIIAENKANLDRTPLLKKTEFQFDHVFGSDATNKQIFESTVLPFISTNHRHNLTYICFGQTGSGKSHTIFGSKSTDGLLVYCTQLLLREANLENNLVCSFYEIYNNQVYDLVNAGKRLFVREDGEHHVNVIGVTEFVLRTLDNLHYVIEEGLARRHHGKSAFNSNSSRSHAVFQLSFKNPVNSTESFRLIFIDLAGSERATDAQNNQRQTRREGAQINCSLLALKECIRSMDLTHSHAPFRQSKLTHILRDSLIGSKTRTCLMANVSPPDDCCQCSLNTLQYASRIRDISIRHRHRSMPMSNVQTNYFHETYHEQDVAQEQTQRSFNPATASTPVHRLVSSADQPMYMSAAFDTKAHTTKPIDIDWQIADDDDLSSTGNVINHLLKPTTSTVPNPNAIQSNNQYMNRFSRKKLSVADPSPSSYFPGPKCDIKRSYPSTHLIYDDGNERQWKVVPAPVSNRLSDSSVEPASATRMIPVAPVQVSEENLYSSGTGTESLGTKITKVAANDEQRRSKALNSFVDNLNFDLHYDVEALTPGVEALLYSDRQETHRDQTEFLTNRDELLSIVSNRLTTGGQRSSSVTTPKSRKNNSHTHSSNSKTRLIKSPSSTTNLTSNQREKKSSGNHQNTKTNSSISVPKFDPNIRRAPHRQQQRSVVPLRGHHSSDSDEPEKTRLSISRRKGHSSKSTTPRAGHLTTKTAKSRSKNEPKLTNEILPREQTTLSSTPTTTPLSPSAVVPSTALQAPLDQMKVLVNRALQPPISPIASVNIDNPWPSSSSYGSPAKDFSLRVSEQLSALRNLLETRLTDVDENKRPKRESSTLQTSHGTFARDFLQSFRRSSLNHSPENNKNDDDDDQEVARNFHRNQHTHKERLSAYEGDMASTTTLSSNPYESSSMHQQQHTEQMIQPNFSSLSDHLNRARITPTATASSTSTITSNLAAKIDTQEPRILSSDNDALPSSDRLVLNPSKNTNGHISRPASDSERTSQVNSALPNPFTGTSSGSSSVNASRSRSPILVPAFSTFDMASNSISHGHDHLLDSGKGSSLLTGSSFDALLNSLKTMREQDLRFVVRTGDDKLISVAD